MFIRNSTSKELVYQKFIQRELGLSHPTYDSELDFYELVRNGDIQALEKRKASGEMKSVNLPERGTLSDDETRNLRYHIIVTVAMLCRFCIEGGLDERDSYGLSDIYISRADRAATSEALFEIHEQAIFDYAQRMKNISKAKVMNIHCIKAMEYISDNLHRSMTVKDVAAQLGLDRTYLGKLFRSETGQTVTAYIRNKKLRTAENMLLYSDFSCLEISEYLGYASQSYFIKVFREKHKMTPLEYKRRHYRKHWENDRGLSD